MRTRLPVSVAVLLLASIALSQETRKPINIDDYFELKSVRDPQISPVEKWIAFTVAESDLEKDKSERVSGWYPLLAAKPSR